MIVITKTVSSASARAGLPSSQSPHLTQPKNDTTPRVVNQPNVNHSHHLCYM